MSVEAAPEIRTESFTERMLETPDEAYYVQRYIHLRESVINNTAHALKTYAENLTAWLNTHDSSGRGNRAFRRQVNQINALINDDVLRAYAYVQKGSYAGIEIAVKSPEKQKGTQGESVPTGFRVTHAGVIDGHQGERDDHKIMNALLTSLGFGESHPDVQVSSVLGTMQHERQKHLVETIRDRIPNTPASVYHRPDGAIRVAFGADASDWQASIFVAPNGRICDVNPDGSLSELFYKGDADLRIENALTAAGV